MAGATHRHLTDTVATRKSVLKRPTALAAIAVLLALIAAGSAWWGFAQATPSASETTALIHSGERTHAFSVEIADTDAKRAQGLMFREELGPNEGMLFDFLEERPVSFWMENTFIPLDMIFARSDGSIVRVHANAVPHDRTPIPSGEPVQFVLEIPGGRADELGIEAGDTLEHPRVAQP